jgi:hypothetical protein
MIFLNLRQNILRAKWLHILKFFHLHVLKKLLVLITEVLIVIEKSFYILDLGSKFSVLFDSDERLVGCVSDEAFLEHGVILCDVED